MKYCYLSLGLLIACQLSCRAQETTSSPRLIKDSTVEMVAGRNAAKEGGLYVFGEYVKKRAERHVIQSVSSTPLYWRKDVSKLYNLYDSLVTKYPDYVSRVVIGTDVKSNPIYAYEFKPKQKLLRRHTEESVAYPKVVIIGGVHGNERNSQIINLTFFNMLCDNYLDDEVLTYLRFNVDIILVPAANPSGVSAGTRYNSNAVDLNRNYASDWKAGKGQIHGNRYTYGTSAFSELESKAIRDFVLQHKDAALVLDTHDGGAPNYYAWFASMHPVVKQIMLKASYDVITMIHQTLRPKKIPEYPFLFAKHENGTFTKWGMQEGIKTGLLEMTNLNELFGGDVQVKRDIFIEILKTFIKAAVDAENNHRIAKSYAAH